MIVTKLRVANNYTDENFYRMVQYRFTRESTVGEIQDVYDGKLYMDEYDFFHARIIFH